MFEEYYEKLPDASTYLKRIGLDSGTVDGSLAALNRIIYAHVQHIPFENLDASVGGKCPRLATRDLFDKIILHRRGGWCHELNALFHAFLTALGYEAYSVGGRVLGKGFVTPIGHHGIICVIEGKKYYCDVGFGDLAFQSAIALDGTPSPFGFHIEKCGDWYEIRRGEKGILSFADLAYEPVDYLFANYTSAHDPNEFFRSTLYVSIMQGETRRLLCGSTLTERGSSGKRVIAEAKNRAELSALLKEYFGIEYDFADLQEEKICSTFA